MRTSLVLSLLLAGCPTDEEATGAEADCSLDADGDGLDDCAEADLGTDPEAADSDGDGFSDADELDCVSDPLDPDEGCFACGWAHNDPGNLESTGSEEGDVVADIAFEDQCQESASLWDFAEEYHVLFMTASW